MMEVDFSLSKRDSSFQDKLLDYIESMKIYLDKSVIIDWFDNIQTQNFLFELKRLLERYPIHSSYSCNYYPNSDDLDDIELFLGLYNLQLFIWPTTGKLLVKKLI